MNLLDKITAGRTDLVFEFLAEGNAATFADSDGVSLVQWCAYYGDVSGIKYLLSKGAPLASLGEELGLNGEAFMVIGSFASFCSKMEQMRILRKRIQPKRLCIRLYVHRTGWRTIWS